MANDLGVPSVTLGRLPIAAIDREASARLMIERAIAARGSEREPAYISSANGQVLSMCARDPALRELFLSADLLHADGMPLVFASRLKCAAPLPERVATTDLFHDVARLAETTGASFYLLGGTRAVIEQAVQNVRRLYPRLNIAGFRHGYSRRGDDEAAIIAEINAARPDILWVGMGVPVEQTFAVRNRRHLTQVGLIKTSGGLFDFLAGRNKRAPAWMQAVGLEWLFRAALEPRRLLVRYLTTNPHAIYLLLTGSSRGVPDASGARRSG
jgi:N-acetylglucosaminyldiphosphoundecaprenol N-acetyl-beta-D-mannosaminyltransferase